MEVIKLFNYKGKDILIREVGKNYQVGIGGDNQLAIWFESTEYDSYKLAVTSGREYARDVIDKMLLAQKEENVKKNRV